MSGNAKPCCSSDSCEAEGTRRPACPACGTRGTPVDLLTVKALLTEAALGALEPGDYRFCADSTCDLVYSSAGKTFSTGDLRVPVWQKQAFGRRLVCYCFGENERDIRSEIVRDGSSPPSSA